MGDFVCGWTGVVTTLATRARSAIEQLALTQPPIEASYHFWQPVHFLNPMAYPLDESSLLVFVAGVRCWCSLLAFVTGVRC